MVCNLHAERWSCAFGKNIGTFSRSKLNYFGCAEDVKKSVDCSKSERVGDMFSENG